MQNSHRDHLNKFSRILDVVVSHILRQADHAELGCSSAWHSLPGGQGCKAGSNPPRDCLCRGERLFVTDMRGRACRDCVVSCPAFGGFTGLRNVRTLQKMLQTCVGESHEGAQPPVTHVRVVISVRVT